MSPAYTPSRDRDYPEDLLAHLDATRERLEPEIEAVISVAKSQIGVVGGRRYCRATGSKPSDPWCVSFVAWCLQKVYGAAPSPIYTPSFCSAALRRWGRRRGLIHDEPRRGDIFLLLRQRGGLCWHAGFVEHVIDEDWFILIDGNGIRPIGTPNDVRRTVRRLSYQPFLFLRWIDERKATSRESPQGNKR